MPRSPERGPNSAEARKPFFDPERDITQVERDEVNQMIEEARQEKDWARFLSLSEDQAILGSRPEISPEEIESIKQWFTEVKSEHLRGGYQPPETWLRIAEEAVKLKLLGIEPELSDDDRSSMMTWTHIEDSGMALGPYTAYHARLKMLGIRPGTPLDSQSVAYSQALFRRDSWGFKGFFLVHGANLAIIGAKPELREEDSIEFQKLLKSSTSAGVLHAAAMATILAAEKIEVPPEGGLILDGRRIGPSPKEGERG